MFDLVEKIKQADGTEIEMLLKAVLQRYAALYPGWEISTISLQKSADRNEQIDRMITMLQNMKTPS